MLSITQERCHGCGGNITINHETILGHPATTKSCLLCSEEITTFDEEEKHRDEINRVLRMPEDPSDWLDDRN